MIKIKTEVKKLFCVCCVCLSFFPACFPDLQSAFTDGRKPVKYKSMFYSPSASCKTSGQLFSPLRFRLSVSITVLSLGNDTTCGYTAHTLTSFFHNALRLIVVFVGKGLKCK